MQGNQPQQQGAAPTTGVYLYCLDDTEYGWPRVDSEWDEEQEKQIQTVEQWFESNFQITTLSIQDPTNINSLTAMDLARCVKSSLQDPTAISTLKANGLGILRIGNIRNLASKNDYDNFEYSPSFDFTITNSDSMSSEIDKVSSVLFNIKRV